MVSKISSNPGLTAEDIKKKLDTDFMSEHIIIAEMSYTRHGYYMLCRVGCFPSKYTYVALDNPYDFWCAPCVKDEFVKKMFDRVTNMWVLDTLADLGEFLRESRSV